MPININLEGQSDEGGNADQVSDQDGHALSHEMTPQESPFYSGAGPACHVSFGAGLTIPTQPYANARPYVSLTLPSDFSNIDDAYTFARDWVDERLADVNKGIQTALKGSSNG